MRRRGFTLVEVVVAAAIAAVALVGVSVAIGGGLMAWGRAQAMAQLTREGTKTLRLLEGQLLRAIASATDPFTFRGSATGLQFMMTDGVGPVQVSWTATAPSEPPGGPGRLIATWQPVESGVSPGSEGAHTMICAGVARVAFAFPVREPPSGYRWVETWGPPNTAVVPQAVRIQLDLTGGRRGGMRFERVVVLPQGTFGQPAPEPA